jgi:hypothetical protein
MRKLTKTEATTKGLKIKKLLDWIELREEKQANTSSKLNCLKRG